MIYEIPLTAAPQKLTITLAGVTYRLTVLWNEAAQIWNLDIADADGVPILEGLAMVAGVNLLEQFDYLHFGGGLYAQTDGGYLHPPNFTNLGTSGHLYFEVVP